MGFATEDTKVGDGGDVASVDFVRCTTIREGTCRKSIYDVGGIKDSISPVREREVGAMEHASCHLN